MRTVDLFYRLEVSEEVAASIEMHDGDILSAIQHFDPDEVSDILETLERFGAGNITVDDRGERAVIEVRRTTFANDYKPEKSVALVEVPLWALDPIIVPTDGTAEVIHNRAWFTLSPEQRNVLQEVLRELLDKYGSGYVTIPYQAEIYFGFNDISDDMEPSIVGTYCVY